MHGTEQRNRLHGAHRLSAPRRAFSPSAGSIPSGTPPAALDRDRPLVTAFRSPATTAPFRSLHYGVDVPGLLLRVLSPACTVRSDLLLHHRPGSPRRRRLQRVVPVTAPANDSNSCSFDLHSPLGILSPSGSKRSIGSATVRSAFRIHPISSRSPFPLYC